MQRFDEGRACASTGCTSSFLLSPQTHLVSVAHLPSACGGCLLPGPAADQCLTLCLGAVWDPKHHLWLALPSRTQRLLTEVSPCRCSAGTGALMQRVCTLRSLFNSAIHRLSKIFQWGRASVAQIAEVSSRLSRVLFLCLRLSACSHSGWGELGCSVCPGDEQLPPAREASSPACS